MTHLRFCYIFAIPFFLTLLLGSVQAQQSPSWAPPTEQSSPYDSSHQNVLEIPPTQQEATIPQAQSDLEDFSLQASLPDDPWYRHQSNNFDDPYYQRQEERVQRARATRRDTSQEYVYAGRGNRQNEYDDYGQTRVTSTTQLPRTYPSTVSQSQAPSALWDVARIMSFAVGAQTGLIRYDSCRRRYSFAGVPLR